LRLVAARVGDVAHLNHASGPDALMIGKRVRHRCKNAVLPWTLWVSESGSPPQQWTAGG
jgi:hypothetical protein